MPTIDQLEPAIVASDDDVLPVSQSGIARGITRSQLLAGTQTSLALTPGLLGRSAAGLGQPQQITIGNGLRLADGTLSSQPQFSTASLNGARTLSLTDLVPVGQSGTDRAVDVRTLLSVAGADISNQLVVAAGGNSRSLGHWVNDAASAESFGAVGDGITDDTDALNAAIISGRPVLLGPKCYRVDGQWTIQTSAVLVGVPGLTVLRRVTQSGGAWINIAGPSFTSANVIFDAGSIAGDSWSVLVSSACTTSVFRNCSFINSTGTTLGSGLTIQARDGLDGRGSSHSIVGCSFQDNSCHGLWVQAAAGADINDCVAAGNGAYGICLDYNDPTFRQQVRQSRVVQCRCYSNVRGISVGNYNETNLEPPRWGLRNPDAVDIVISGNICSYNKSYGVAVSGKRLQVNHNQITLSIDDSSGSGILCNASLSRVQGNTIVGPGQYGIDSGGSVDLTISENTIENFLVGINAGGSQRVCVYSNNLIGNQRAITIFQVETDGRGLNFGIPCADIWIERNSIALDVGSSGISITDCPDRIQIKQNRFLTSPGDPSPDLCLAKSDTVSVDGNSVNGLLAGSGVKFQNGSSSELLLPRMLDTVIIDESIGRVDSMLDLSLAQSAGIICFARVTGTGTGYTWANVSFLGAGTGATAVAYLRDGSLVGIALQSGGANYSSSTTTIVIAGDGQGATAIPFIGLPLFANQRLTLYCAGPVTFSNGGAPAQSSWTQADINVPAQSTIVWRSSPTGWQATQFDNVSYFLPATDGSVSVQATAGDIRLRPAGEGHVRICSASEAAGFLVSYGRGSPENVVTAPPGSDYRNLDGGVGQTLWLKRSGNSNVGWFALA